MSVDWMTRRLGIAIVIGAALAIAGLLALLLTQQLHSRIEVEAQAANRERNAMQVKLSQATQEKSEITDKLEEYKRLLQRGVIGTEKRLDWVDALLIVREENKLPDLKYSIDPQKPLDYPEIPKSTEVETLSSPMKLELAMLHEGDLFRVLAGLRQRLPPRLAIKDCVIERNRAAAAAQARGPATHLRAVCNVDLITIHEKGDGA